MCRLTLFYYTQWTCHDESHAVREYFGFSVEPEIVIVRVDIAAHAVFECVVLQNDTRALNACSDIFMRYALRLILPELVANMFKHRNRIPRTRCDILRHYPFIHPHSLRKPNAYHAIRVVWVNLAKRAVGNCLVLRVVLVMQEELNDLS